MTTIKAKTAKACQAMKTFGITEAVTKPVLKALLKVYDQNWNHIEDEEYGVLLDAILDKSAPKRRVEGSKRGGNLLVDEVEEEDESPPLKRRLRSSTCLGSSQMPIPKSRYPSNPSSVVPYQRRRVLRSIPERSELPVSGNLFVTENVERKEFDELEEDDECPPLVRRLNKNCAGSSRSIPEKSELPVPGINLSVTEKVPHNSLIEAREFDDDDFDDDYFDDDGILQKCPIATIFPADTGSSKEVGSSQVGSSREHLNNAQQDRSEVGKLTYSTEFHVSWLNDHCPSQGKTSCPKAPAYPELIDLDSPDISGQDGCSNEVTENLEANALEMLNPKLADKKESSELNSTFLEIASSVNREVKIALIHSSSHQRSLRSVLKAVEEKCIKIYAITRPGFSMLNLLKDVCDSFLLDQSGSIDDEQVKANEGVDVNSNTGSRATTSSGKKYYYVNDITRGREERSISIINEISDDHKPAFCYISKNVRYEKAHIFSLAEISDKQCCTGCTGDCTSEAIPCACTRITDGECAYTKKGLLSEKFLDDCIFMTRDPQKQSLFYCQHCPLMRKSLTNGCKGHLTRKFIKECWFKCACSYNCGNRIVQHGITAKLQVFMTPEGKGWGVRTLEELPKGAFICEYVGEILTKSEVSERSNHNQVSRVPLDANWGSKNVLGDEKVLCLDATFCGNVARFFNHRCCDANMIQIPVEVETPDHHYYHFAFFSTRKVNAFAELTWDYSVESDDNSHLVKAFNCRCGSKFCRNIARKERI